MDAVSLFPAENIREGAQNPWPFREDLLDMLKSLKPRCVLLKHGPPLQEACMHPMQETDPTQSHCHLARLQMQGHSQVSLG